MSEELQTRTEHSRSLEDAGKYRALETLKEVGLLIPVSDLETYHGRAGFTQAGEEWTVDPGFANGSNDSGNYNYNKRTSLYTSQETVAKDFADVRTSRIAGQRFRRYFADKVRNYTPEERQEWVARENKRRQQLLENVEPRYLRHYEDMLDESGQPKILTIDDLSVGTEADRLEAGMPEDEKLEIRRRMAEGLQAEVHEIVTSDTDATVLDLTFDAAKLDDEARGKYQKALVELLLPATVGSPVNFNDRDAIRPFRAALQQLGKGGYVEMGDVKEIAANARLDERTVLQLGSALNTRYIVQQTPAYLVKQLMKQRADIFVETIDTNKGKQNIPVNLEYVQNYLRENHIVGVKQSITSDTLDRKIISLSFFDLERTSTRQGLEAERRDIWQRLGGMATGLAKVTSGELQSRQPLMKLLSDVYAKPGKLVAAAKQVDGYDAIFEASAGNWEGFSLAEHTETVLRNFDENFADKLPVSLIAPMRLAILGHDIGKPLAAARGEKHKQIEYNVKQAADFFGKLGVDDKLQGLLIAMIGEGEELAFQINVRHVSENAHKAMNEFAITTLRKFYATENVTAGQVTGFIEMCKMLQICDGGAYTSMAVTDRGIGRGRYRNAPSFNSSFANPVGFGKRALQLRRGNDKPAANDLTPKSQ